jgi:hypothetical protein
MRITFRGMSELLSKSGKAEKGTPAQVRRSKNHPHLQTWYHYKHNIILPMISIAMAPQFEAVDYQAKIAVFADRLGYVKVARPR